MVKQRRTVPYHRYAVTRRTHLEAAARERLKDAQVLQKAERYIGAQYMGGYVIECLLKCIICAKYGEVRLEEAEVSMSRQRGRTISLRTHELEVLLSYANLRNSLRVEGLWESFMIVNEWSSELRYYSGKATFEQSERFFEAVGVLLPFLYARL
ncbi:hypothetical protein FJZ31_19855 [Candidatus Poribacteria bacterium]|nr:hypothetical protein [Candidatus Poribacteria bacterium]